MTRANQAQLQPLIDGLSGQIAAATNATTGLAGTVLAYTPAQWNSNHHLLGAPESSVQSARGALQKGRSDVIQIRQFLKTGHASGSATTTAALSSSQNED